MPLKEQIYERSSEFWNSEKSTNPDNLIYKYKTEGKSPKDSEIVKIR